MWHCPEVVLQDGPEPSYAVAIVPLSALDETAPAVACVRTGPAGHIRIGQPVQCITSSGVVLLRGRVAVIGHAFKTGRGGDQVAVTIKDDRWLMAACPTVGSFWATTNGICYRQGFDLKVNPGAQPNGIWRNGYLVLCQPNQGLRSGDVPPKASAGSTTKACYFDNAGVFNYAYYAFKGPGVAMAQASFPFYPSCPSSVSWDKGVASVWNDDTPRKAREQNFAGMNLNHMLAEICQNEGSWAPYLTAEGVLKIVPTKSGTLSSAGFSADTGKLNGSSLSRPNSGQEAATALADAKMVIAGSLDEDGTNLYNRNWSSGLITMIERRVESLTPAGLGYGWNTPDQNAFIGFVESRVRAGDSTADAFGKGFQKFPDVFGTYRILDTFNFQAGTTENSLPRGNLGRPILDTLLSSFLEGTQYGALSGDSRSRYKISVEIYSRDTSTWIYATEGDGLTLDGDGKIRIPGLRNVSRSYTGGYSGTQAFIYQSTGFGASFKFSSFQPVPIRITVAIPCDHRLNATAQAGNDMDRVESADNGFQRLYHAHTELYGREIRVSSWPIPESVNGSTVASSIALRDDMDNLNEHVARRLDAFGRLQRGGQLILPNFNLALDIGQTITYLGDYPVFAPVRRIRYRSASGVQDQTLCFDTQPFVGADGVPDRKKLISKGKYISSAAANAYGSGGTPSSPAPMVPSMNVYPDPPPQTSKGYSPNTSSDYKPSYSPSYEKASTQKKSGYPGDDKYPQPGTASSPPPAASKQSAPSQAGMDVDEDAVGSNRKSAAATALPVNTTPARFVPSADKQRADEAAAGARVDSENAARASRTAEQQMATGVSF